jgi:hypothetical protein
MGEAMTRYALVSVWRIPAPLIGVWEAFLEFDRWPEWWRGLEEVVLLRPARGPYGVGAVRRCVWRSRLPYRLECEVEVTDVEPMRRIEVRSRGELEGIGRWSFWSEGEAGVVRYDWIVCTRKRWMNRLAPIARPLFEWNHRVLMRWGEEGLIRFLRQKVGE